MHPARPTSPTSPASSLIVPALALAAIGLSLLACSTGSGSGYSMSGVSSTVQDVAGSPEEREARRQEKLRESCGAEAAYALGQRHGRMSRRRRADKLAECPDDLEATAVAEYDAGYVVGLEEAAQNAEYWQEQEDLCDASRAYERGYNDGMAMAPQDSSFATTCVDTFVHEELSARYQQGYGVGQAEAQALAAAEAQMAADQIAAQQSRICDPNRALEAGQNDGQMHASLNSDYLLACEDEGAREEARIQYYMGYQLGFGLGLVDDVQKREVALQQKLDTQTGAARATCDFNAALEIGYNDGRRGRDLDSSDTDRCPDAELRAESKQRYLAGYEEGKRAFDAQANDQQDDADIARQRQLCDDESAFERGFNDGLGRRPMSSGWLNDCEDDALREAAKQSYRAGYMSARR